MKCFLCLAGLILSFFCQAQWFKNTHTLTTEDGLTNNTITCLQKDAAGFLWIGTHEGLNRYDGTSFLNVISNSKNNLPSNNIYSITFISPTILAVATEAGLCLLNTITLEGKRIELPFNSNFPGTGYLVDDILYDSKKNELWVGTWHGLFVLNNKGDITKKILSSGAMLTKGAFARHLLKDEKGDVYFYSMQNPGFFYPDFTTGEAVPAERKQPAFTLNDLIRKGYSLRSADMLKDESICLLSRFSATGSDEYLAYRNLSTGRNFIDKIAVAFPYEKRFASAFPLSDSVFVVNSYFGEPLLYNTNDKRLRKASDNPLWFTSWPDGIATVLFKDDRFTWVGTAKGLIQSSEQTHSFTSNSLLINTINRNSGLVSYSYGHYDGNKFWVSCMGAGLFSFDSSTSKLQTVFQKISDPSFRKKMVSTDIIDAGNSFWLYSVYGPSQVDKATLKVKPVDGIGKENSFDDFANYPLKDSKGNIWSTLPNGLTKYNITTGTFINFKTAYHGGIFPLLRAGPKTEDGKGNIWAARQDTLVKFDIASQKFSVMQLVKDGKALRPINNLASDGEDILYMNVAGAFGIYHISTGKIELYTKQTGIISTVINGITADKKGNAWIATEAGLVLYNKQKKKFSSYTKADGLPDDNVMALNFADANRNILFLGFASTYGLFEPANFLPGKNIPLNEITDVDVNGESMLDQHSPRLSYQRNSISFTYTGINFNQGQQNNYACILEGFDQDWKFQGAERKINYINLPAGEYTFKVKTANHQGEWNEQPAVFKFEILPPFWQRWWFRLLAVILVGVTLYFFIKRREAAIKRANETRLQMSELRMQALRAQMNPHFIFNSLNSIQNYILSNNTMDAASYLSKFARLMRRILEQSKNNLLPLGEVIETLRMYVEIEAFRFNNEFTYSFNIENNYELLDVMIPPMLLQPFVENAILHGLMPKVGDKKLTIDCRISDKRVIVIIDDNGVGRGNTSPKAGHNSQGEKLTAGMLETLQQLKNIKATIVIKDKMENGLASGTQVQLIFTLNQ